MDRSSSVAALAAVAALLAFGASAPLLAGVTDDATSDGVITPPPDATPENRSGGAGVPTATRTTEPCEHCTASGGTPPSLRGLLAQYLGWTDGLLVVGGLLATLALVAAAGWFAGDDTDSLTADDDDRDGAASGDECDRSWPDPSVPVDNDVYRAWRALADRAGDSPADTPTERAAAAREAGLDPEAVRETTELFRAVRYGDAAPDAERAARARAARERLAEREQREGDP